MDAIAPAPETAASGDEAPLGAGEKLSAYGHARRKRDRRRRLVRLGFSEGQAEELSALHTANFM